MNDNQHQFGQPRLMPHNRNLIFSIRQLVVVLLLLACEHSVLSTLSIPELCVFLIACLLLLVLIGGCLVVLPVSVTHYLCPNCALHGSASPVPLAEAEYST